MMASGGCRLVPMKALRSRKCLGTRGPQVDRQGDQSTYRDCEDQSEQVVNDTGANEP